MQVGIVPVMVHPDTGVPVLILHTLLKRTLHGHTYTMCDAFWGAQCATWARAVCSATLALAQHASGLAVDTTTTDRHKRVARRILAGNHIAGVTTSDTTSVYFITAQWRPGFVPRVIAPAFQDKFIAAVHGYVDVHGKGRSYSVDVSVPRPDGTAITLPGFRFVPLYEVHIQCLSVQQALAAMVGDGSKPYLPQGVFHMVSPDLHTAVHSLKDAMPTSDIS